MNSHWRTTSAVVILLVFANFNLSLSVRHSKHHRRGGPSSYLHDKTSHYNAKHGPDCYHQRHCSPPITDETMAVLTLNSFADGGDGGGPSECDGKYHSDDELVVALSTKWYNHGSLCFKKIRINGNGKSVLAKVVDECDSENGYDAVHGFQPPCPSYVVDASPAVWEALGVSRNHVGYYHITWSED